MQPPNNTSSDTPSTVYAMDESQWNPYSFSQWHDGMHLTSGGPPNPGAFVGTQQFNLDLSSRSPNPAPTSVPNPPEVGYVPHIATQLSGSATGYSIPRSAPASTYSHSRRSSRGAPGPTLHSRRSTTSSSSPPARVRGTGVASSSSQYSHINRARLEQENQMIVRLRDHEGLPWKEITRQLSSTFGRNFQQATLQMRYGRLRAKSHPWTDDDTSALRQAHSYYMENRWNIIADKMVEFGATDAWSARTVANKWRQINNEPASRSDNTPQDPQIQRNIHTFSASVSPTDWQG